MSRSLRIEACPGSQIETVRALFREYQRSLDADLCFQGFEAELAGLPGSYAPPRGRLLLASKGTNVAGCVALRPLSEHVCEMKRLFVRPVFRGDGLGRQLAERVIAEAQQAGYRTMRLDTLPEMVTAQALYVSLGFRDGPAYYDNPVPGVRYLERAL